MKSSLISTKIKKLNLELWMIRDHLNREPLLGSEFYPEFRDEEISALGKNGYYYSCGFCWIEAEGRLFHANPDHWKNSFQELCASELNHRQVQALVEISKAKLASREQKNLLRSWENYEISRNIRRQIKMKIISWRKS